MKQTILFLAIMLLFGCSNMMDSDRSQNYEWLDVENPTENLSELSPTDYNRVMTAMERVVISFDPQGVAVLRTKSGKEVNVSSEVFRYIVQIVSLSNDRLKGIAKRPRMLTRSETEEGNAGGGQNSFPEYFGNNCVAVSIAKATGLKQRFVEMQLMEKYGLQGVPTSKFDEAMSMFATWIPLSPTKDIDMREFDNKAVVVARDIDDNNSPFYHATNVRRTFNEYVLANDFQKPSGNAEFTTRMYPYSQVEVIYKLDKVHNFDSNCYENR